MAQGQINLVNENALDKQRVDNMISEGGLGALYYYNDAFYDENGYELEQCKAMQDRIQQFYTSSD